MTLETAIRAIRSSSADTQACLIDFANQQGNGKMSLKKGTLVLDPNGEFTGVGYCGLTAAALELALINTHASSISTKGVFLRGGDSQPSAYNRDHTILQLSSSGIHHTYVDFVYKQKNFSAKNSLQITPENELMRVYPKATIDNQFSPGELVAFIKYKIEYELEYLLLFDKLEKVFTRHLTQALLA